MASGVRTAHDVPPSTLGSDQRSSVRHSRGGSIERSTRRWWSPCGRRGCGCDSVRRVTRCAASTEGRAAMASGVRTAHGVPPSTMGSDHRSSVGHSRGGSSEHRMAFGARANRAYEECGRVVGVGALWIDMNEFDPANSRCRTRMGVNHSRVPSFMMFRTHGRRHSNQTDSQRANRAYEECGSCSRCRGIVDRHE